jgi:hypothetical protein
VLPRATVVGEYRVVSPARAIIDSVSAGGHDPTTLTWLETDPHLTLGPVAGAKAEITSYRLNDLAVRVTTPGAALLRVSDLWYPDWVATVDGKPAEILRADFMLRAVPVPAGTHTVEFQFRTPAVRLGLTLSIASLFASLALLAVGLVRGRSASGRPPAAGATRVTAGAR